MASLKPLIREVMGAARAQLVELNFRKRSGDLYTYELNAESLGWLALMRVVVKNQGIQIMPNVGVRNQRIEKMVAELLGEPFHPYHPPTLLSSIGYLMEQKQYLRWSFTSDGENAGIMQHMIQSICVYGIPFMKANADLNSVLEALLHTRYSIRQDYTLPVAYLLSGKPQEARACVTKYVNTLGKDPAAQNYRRFAANLLKRLAN
jgi:hypothetical protein